MRPPGQQQGRGLLSEDRDPPPPGYARDLSPGLIKWEQMMFLGEVVAGLAGKLRDRAHDKHPR